MDYIEIQSRLKRLNRSQKYLSKIFKKPESHISHAIRGKQYPELRDKIVNHIKLLEEKK